MIAAGAHDRILTGEGAVVPHASSPYYTPDAQQELLGVLGSLFRGVPIYDFGDLTYPGGPWSFSYASKGTRCLVGGLDLPRLRDSALELRFYSPDVHRAAFVLPAFQARALAGVLTPLGAGATPPGTAPCSGT